MPEMFTYTLSPPAQYAFKRYRFPDPGSRGFTNSLLFENNDILYHALHCNVKIFLQLLARGNHRYADISPHNNRTIQCFDYIRQAGSDFEKLSVPLPE